MCVGEGFNGVNATHVPQLSVESFKLRKLLRDNNLQHSLVSKAVYTGKYQC